METIEKILNEKLDALSKDVKIKHSLIKENHMYVVASTENRGGRCYALLYS